MPQKQGQTLNQEQKLTQKMRLSPQQLLTVNMIGMPIAELEEYVKNEVEGNSSIESDNDDFFNSTDSSQDSGADDNGMEGNESDDAQFEDQPIQDSSMSRDEDEDEISVGSSKSDSSDGNVLPIGDSISFIDYLNDQISDHNLNEEEQYIIQYLIGSLNNNGFIDRELGAIADDLAIDEGIDVTKEELIRLLKVLQQFEPAGIGARNNQECQLIQLARMQEETGIKLTVEQEIIANHYDDFLNQRTRKLTNSLGITDVQLNQAIDNIRHWCNPRPGVALCESSTDIAQTVVPDFIIETTIEGDISFSINDGNIPKLHVSKDSLNQLEQYEQKQNVKQYSEALEFTRQKVNSAKEFIESIHQRHNTLSVIMKALINHQRQFILSQDTADLLPLRLEDIANETHMGISTVSRVQSSKYAQIDGTLYQLNIFFKRNRVNDGGEDIDFEHTCEEIRDIISNENKAAPLSDEKIASKLKQRGINIKRRTVAKYRDLMGISTASKRIDKV